MERRLAAILCGDVSGYSRLMGADEEATLKTLSSRRSIIDRLIAHHRGRFVNSAGDSVLAEFASVVNAVQCAVEIQRTLKAENAEITASRRMEFRIGVNLGDVMVEGDQLYGDGVNVAARLEGLAEPGGICISGTVREHLGNKLALSYADLGPQSVKNIVEPIRVFKVLPDQNATTLVKIGRPPRRYLRHGVFSGIGLAIIAGTIVIVQHLALRTLTPRASIPLAQNLSLQLPTIPSIAVLPFVNMSGDHEQEYFSDGITDDLTTALAKLPGLLVIARTSAFAYKGKSVRVQEVSKELGVKYLLEGSVRKGGNEIRITAQLVDATTGDHLWAEHYDGRPFHDIFALQDEIVQKIVTTLNLRLSLAEAGTLVAKQTDNLEAYDDFLRGLGHLRSGSVEPENRRAREMFDKAVALDPKYADALTELGYTYYTDWIWHWGQEPNPLNLAFEIEQRAAALDDSQALAHALLGELHLLRREYDQSLFEGERAVTVGPNLALAYFWLADILNRLARPAEALDQVEKAIRLDPRNRYIYLFQMASAYTRMGRYSEAIPLLKSHLSSLPNSPGAHVLLIVDYTELGREQEAKAEATEVLRIDPGFSIEVFKQRIPDRDPNWLRRRDVDLRRAGLS